VTLLIEVFARLKIRQLEKIKLNDANSFEGEASPPSNTH
jgi:hypothetical protein